MGQQEYQAGANMAFKAFGIVDQMQQRQMMQQLQEQQMGQQALQMQLIQAQIKKANDDANEITKQRAFMGQPVSNFMQSETKSVPAPQYQPGGGMPPFAPGAMIQQPTGRNIFQMPPGATVGEAMQLSPLQKALEPKDDWESIGAGGSFNRRTGERIEPTPSSSAGFTLGPGQTRYNAQGIPITSGGPVSQKPISMGNAIEAAMNEKFGMGWMNDPETQKQAHLWVGTSEGKQRVSEWAQRLTPPSYTFPVTSEGIVPAISRGPGAGTMGQPTGYGKPMSSEYQTKISFINTIKDSVKKVESLILEHGLPSQISGLYGETVGRAAPTPKGYEDLRANLATLQDLVYPKTGKALNEEELKQLVKYIPQMTDKEETKRAKLDTFKRNLQSLHDRAVEEAKSTGGLRTGETPNQPKSNIPQTIQGRGWKATPVQ